MTSSELKSKVEASGHEPYFFDRKTMKFFGDTMKNYGVRETTVDTCTEEKVPVYELYRKHPVKHNNQSSAYFHRESFRRVFEKK